MHQQKILDFDISQHEILAFQGSVSYNSCTIGLILFLYSPAHFILGLFISSLYYKNMLGLANFRIFNRLANFINSVIQTDKKQIDQGHVQVLMGMGFSKERVVEALELKDSLEAATQYLLDHSS
jgi:hypothetical protein